MLIGGLQKSTLIDYPAKVACTVFLIGCNFRCPFCYSSELVLPEKIKKQPKISEKEFFAFLKERRGLLDGVVICGGEPTLHPGLIEFIKKIKRLGFLVKLDTNGTNPALLSEFFKLRLLDYVAMDVKAPLRKQSYEKAAGVKVDLAKIKKSIALIKNSGVGYEFRSTVVPTLHAKADVLQMAQDLSPARAYFLQNFRPEKTLDPRFSKIKPYPQAFLQTIYREIRPLFERGGVR